LAVLQQLGIKLLLFSLVFLFHGLKDLVALIADGPEVEFAQLGVVCIGVSLIILKILRHHGNFQSFMCFSDTEILGGRVVDKPPLPRIFNYDCYILPAHQAKLHCALDEILLLPTIGNLSFFSVLDGLSPIMYLLRHFIYLFINYKKNFN